MRHLNNERLFVLMINDSYVWLVMLSNKFISPKSLASYAFVIEQNNVFTSLDPLNLIKQMVHSPIMSLYIHISEGWTA